MRLSRLAPIMLTAALAGCGSFGAVGLGPMDQQKPIQSDTLPPVASAPVEKSALPPPPVDPNAQTLPPSPPASATLPPADADTATLPPAGGGTQAPAGATPARAELGRTDLLGGWSLRSGAESCQLFMTLTSWTGGYRASTRGCQSPTLKGISAWSLNGSQVVLAGAGGAPIAHLSAAGTNSFAGTADSGQPIAFSR